MLGALRGLAHAGAKGNKQAIIAAGLFDAVQVRIANVVKEIAKLRNVSEEFVAKISLENAKKVYRIDR